MHQFWFTISKIKDSSTYKFKLDNKTFKIGVEVFREALEICPRLPNQRFVEPPSHEETVSFIKEIGYKGDLESITELFTDHMYQPWRQFDQLILSRAQILFTKEIIQHFISKDKTIAMRNKLFMHTIKDDSVLGGLKFVSKHEDSQVYGKIIPNSMVSRKTMKTTTYKTYLAFSTGKVIPKKARKRPKTATTPKKKSSLSADDNIISKDPDAALELAKSISRTEAEEQEAARLVHETHEQRLAADTKKAIKASILVIGPQQTASSSKEVGLIPEVPDEPKGQFCSY
ncbi:hypothetical protein Tco_0999729 [Tanacetum coccineum]